MQIYSWTGIDHRNALSTTARGQLLFEDPYMSPFSWIIISGAAITNASPREWSSERALDEAHTMLSASDLTSFVPDGAFRYPAQTCTQTSPTSAHTQAFKC